MLSRFAVLSSVVAVALSANLHDRSYYEEKFINWMSEHDIKPTSGEHFVRMIQNFADNDDIIENHNAKGESYTLGHNQFSHMSLDEFRSFLQLNPMPEHEPAEFIHEEPADVSTLAGSIDWTTKGAVTPVKDQGQCGSCWSFSATGALEGAYYNKKKTLVSFSEQNLVDCDNFKNGGKDMGCNGGLMDSAFDWVKKNGGLCTESGYPYTSGTTKKSGDCKKTCTKNTDVAVKSFTDVKKNSDTAMMDALNKQPVSVAIEADQSAFQLYKSGVFTAACGTKLDHGVLAVGYGVDGANEFYKIKNSWGSGWGENGYIRFVKGGKTQAAGQCGVLSGPPSYPNL